MPMWCSQLLFIMGISLISLSRSGNTMKTESDITCNQRIGIARPGTDIRQSCHCNKCPAGFHRKRKCTSKYVTKCTPCPMGTFSSYRSNRCRKCKVCPKGFYQISACSPTHNTKCRRCKHGRHLSRSGVCPICSCPPGTYVSQNCTDVQDALCEPCPFGSYSSSHDIRNFCRACHICRNFEEVHQYCNATHNTQCGDCRQGFFRLYSTNQCAMCSRCYYEAPGFHPVVIPECQRMMKNSNYVCMPVEIPPYIPPSSGTSRTTTTDEKITPNVHVSANIMTGTSSVKNTSGSSLNITVPFSSAHPASDSFIKTLNFFVVLSILAISAVFGFILTLVCVCRHKIHQPVDDMAKRAVSNKG